MQLPWTSIPNVYNSSGKCADFKRRCSCLFPISSTLVRSISTTLFAAFFVLISALPTSTTVPSSSFVQKMMSGLQNFLSGFFIV